MNNIPPAIVRIAGAGATVYGYQNASYGMRRFRMHFDEPMNAVEYAISCARGGARRVGILKTWEVMNLLDDYPTLDWELFTAENPNSKRVMRLRVVRGHVATYCLIEWANRPGFRTWAMAMPTEDSAGTRRAIVSIMNLARKDERHWADADTLLAELREARGG